MSRTKEEILDIIKLYETKSQKEIGEIYGLTSSYIGVILRKNNAPKHSKGRLNMSKIPLDFDYFKIINSNQKAYWLGYLAADGYIDKSGGKTYLISKDKEIIEKFKFDVGSGHKVSERNNFDKRTNKTYRSYTVQITNYLFTQNLCSFGVNQNKSDIFNFPNINEKYYSYFIAGLFDGDGSVSFRTTNKNLLRINLISSFETLTFIQNYLVNNVGINKIKMFRITENKLNIWKMHLYKDAVKFLDFIYQDNTFFYMKRKYDIYNNNKNNEL